MIALDMKTVMFANVTVNLVGMVIMFTLWFQNHNKYAGLFYWVLDWVLLTTGTLLITLQSTLPPWASMILSNTLIVGGTVILYFGLSRFAGKKNSPVLISSVWVLFAIFIAVHSYFTYIHNDLVSRSYNVSVGLLLACLLGIWLMLRGAPSEIRRFTKGTGIALAIIAVICVARILGFALIPQMSNQFLQSDKFDALMVMLLGGAIAFLVVNLVLMVNNRLYFETEEMKTKLNRSVTELQAIFKNTSVGFGILVNRVFIEVNDPWCELTGYFREEIIGQGFNMFFPTDEEYRAIRQTYQKITQAGSVTTETGLLRKDGEKIDVIINTSAFDKNDLSKGAVFSILDITERKRLEEKANYLASFPELNPNPILELDQDGHLKYQNPAAKSAFHELETMGINHPFLADWLQVSQELGKANWTETVVHEIKVGSEWYEQTISPVTKNQIRIYARKITKRKQAEEALITSEVSYRRLFESAKDGILIIDANTGLITDANPFLNDLLGISLKEIKGKELWEIGTFSDIISNKTRFEELRQKGYMRYEDLPLKTADGRHISVEFISNVYDVDHRRVIQCNIRDITERKQAEETLKTSEEKYATLIEQSIDGILILKNRLITFANRRMPEMTGFSQEELLGKYFYQLAAPEYTKMLEEEYHRRQAGEEVSGDHELEILTKDGIKIAVETKVRRITYQEQPAAMIIIRDITERKQAETALRESEENLRISLENAPDGVYLCDLNGTFLYGNKKAEEIIGYKKEELIGNSFLNLNILPAGYLQKIGELLKLNATGKPTGPDELELIRKDKNQVWVEISTATIKQKGNDIIIGFVRDITERKRAEEGLIKSRQQYQTLVDNASEAITVAQDRHFKYMNRNMLELCTGYSEQELTDKPFTDFVHPDDRAQIIEYFSKRIKNEPSLPKHEYRIIMPNRGIKWLETHSTLIEWENKPATLNFTTDITERKQAEALLKESEARYKTLFESAAEGILIADIETQKQKYANPAICKMLGYSQEELTKMSVIDIHPRGSLEQVNAEFSAQSRGEKVTSLLPCLRKDGTVIYTEINATKAVIDGRECNIGFFIDVTERKKAEEQIRASLLEKETLLKEVHHRVKNNMQVISSLLRLQEGIVKDKASAMLLRDSQNRIQSMALVYNKLYQSQNLASINMTDYVNELTAGLIKSYAFNPNKVTVSTVFSDAYLAVDMAIPCGLVINELVTNSLKYAFPENKTGRIVVSLKEDTHQALELVISDNGVGIPDGIDMANNSTLGLKLVGNLVQNQLGGKIELERSHGTTFKITFPRPMEEK